MTAVFTAAPVIPAAQDPDVTVWVGATRLTGVKSVRYEQRLSAVGSWSIVVHVTDPQLALLADDAVVEFREFGAAAMQGFVAERVVRRVTSGGAAAQVVEVSGPTIAGELNDAVIYPPRPIEPWSKGQGLDGLRLSTMPSAETVYYNYASMDLDRSSWTSAVATFDVDQTPAQAAPSGYDGEPAVWPGRGCKFIAPRAISGGAHPNGIWYAATLFSTIGAAAFSFDFYTTCAALDGYEVWIDGVMVCEVDQTEGNKTRMFNIELSGDWHAMVVKVVHGGTSSSGEITGFAADGFRHYADGGGLLFAPVLRTSSAWSVADYPTDAPGFTIDEIIADQFNDAQARGTNLAWTLDVDTSTHKDSNGETLPLVEEFPVRVGDGFTSFLDQLSEQYVEWYASDRTLKVAGIKGEPKPGGGTYAGLGVVKNFTLEPVVDPISELTEHHSTKEANVVLSRWVKGYFEISQDPMVQRRKEKFLSIPESRSGLQTFYHTAQTYNALSVPADSIDAFRHKLDATTLYEPGDTVTIDTDGTPTAYRCRSRVVELAPGGYGIVTSMFGTPRDTELERIDRWQRRASEGTLDGRSSSATPSSPFIHQTSAVVPITLYFSMGGVVLAGDRGSPARCNEPLLVLKAEIEADIAGVSGATTAKIEKNGASIGTVSAASGVRRGSALLTPTMMTVFDWMNVEITGAGGHEGVTVTVFCMAATWS